MKWQGLPQNFELNPHHISLWRLSLKAGSFSQLPFAAILSLEEKKRAHRYHFEQDRICFAYFRGCLRILLGQYLNRRPESLEILENAFGKPLLKLLSGEPAIFFNLSHSENVGVLALNPQSEVGVDVEKLQERTDGEGIAKRYFSPAEQKFLNQCPPSERQKTFFQLWTRKEAYLKALGKGFSKNLNGFQVVDEKGRFLERIQDLEGGGGNWEVSAFEVFPHYIGALVFPSPAKIIHYFEGSSLEELQNL